MERLREAVKDESADFHYGCASYAVRFCVNSGNPAVARSRGCPRSVQGLRQQGTLLELSEGEGENSSSPLQFAGDGNPAAWLGRESLASNAGSELVSCPVTRRVFPRRVYFVQQLRDVRRG